MRVIFGDKLYGKKKVVTAQEVAAIYRSGCNQREIAEQVGCDPGTISKFLRINRIQSRSPGEVLALRHEKQGHMTISKLLEQIEDIKHWYYDDEESIARISDRLHISATVLRRTMEHAGLKRRTLCEARKVAKVAIKTGKGKRIPTTTKSKTVFREDKREEEQVASNLLKEIARLTEPKARVKLVLRVCEMAVEIEDLLDKVSNMRPKQGGDARGAEG